MQVSDIELDKEAWLSSVMLDWGTCAQIARSQVSTTHGDASDGNAQPGEVVGAVFYAPPRTVPRAQTFPTAPVSPDAVLLTWLTVEMSSAHDGLDEALVQAALENLIQRGVRAVEAFGVTSLHDADDPLTACTVCGCAETRVLSAKFLERVGFTVIAPHHRYPRLRYELNQGLGWKAGVGSCA